MKVFFSSSGQMPEYTDFLHVIIHQSSYHQTLNSLDIVRSEVFTAVTMKNAVFWNVAPCSFCVNRRFGGLYRFHIQKRHKYLDYEECRFLACGAV
jgi:hypothetical protein